VSDYSEAEQYERAKSWVMTNGLWIIAGIALGAGALGGWNWYKERRNVQAETASARYEEMIEAYSRNDRTRGQTLVDELNREYSWTPYASLATLMAAKFQVEANELDKAVASLKSVMDSAPDNEVRLIARTRLARVQAAQGKYDDALATLKVDDPGEFAPRLADARGDVLLAKGDRSGALREYLAARSNSSDGRVDTELLDLKIRDLGGTPPASAEDSSAAAS
jgi:predicted negative regulator of RcsB-dependent stress response